MRTPIRPAKTLGPVAASLLVPALGHASQGPGAGAGTAGPLAQAAAAAMVLFPAVAVAVFALARLVSGRD